MSSNHGSHIDGILFDYEKLGTGLCSIINSKEQVEQLKIEFQKNMKKYIKYDSIKNNGKINLLNIQNNITTIFNELLKISPYFIFSKNSFVKYFENVTETIKKEKINDINKLYKENIDKILNAIIKLINLANIYKDNEVNAFLLPEARITCNIKKEKSFSIRYIYVVSTLEQFITISYYQTKLNKRYLMKCNYPNCNMYFVASRGQERFCTNPCPDNPDETCRSIPKKREYNSDEIYKWEFEFEDLNLLYKRLNERFNDRRKRKTTNESNKKKLLNNKKKFMSYVTQLKSLIKGATKDENRNYYLKIYGEFLNDTDKKLKKSLVATITKPKY